MLKMDDRAAMEAFTDTLHPATVAESLTDAFSIEETWPFLHARPGREAGGGIPVLLHRHATRDRQGGRPRADGPPDRGDEPRQPRQPVRQLPVPVRDSLLRLFVDEADRRNIVKLIQYPEDTAGALMTTRYRLAAAQHHDGRRPRTHRLPGPRQRDDLLRLHRGRPASPARRRLAARPHHAPPAHAHRGVHGVEDRLGQGYRRPQDRDHPRRHRAGRNAAGGRCDDRPGRGEHRARVQRGARRHRHRADPDGRRCARRRGAVDARDHRRADQADRHQRKAGRAG